MSELEQNLIGHAAAELTGAALETELLRLGQLLVAVRALEAAQRLRVGTPLASADTPRAENEAEQV